MATITIKEWLDANGRTRSLPTDPWYLDFVRRVLPLIRQSSLFGSESSHVQAKAAIRTGMYFRDAISQNGGWKTFSALYTARYGMHLPFYTPTDEYVPDEINQEDVAFILWTQKPCFFNPYEPSLQETSLAIYELMDECFEEAPVCNEPSPEDWVMRPDWLETPVTPLPEITPGTVLKKDAERCLAYSKGKPLLYFADYRELHTFFIEVLEWDEKDASLLRDLEDKKEFVIYANAKGMLIAHDVAAYFCEAHNPTYNAKRAATEGYEMFCQPGRCPFDLLKYGMATSILPDVALPFQQGKETLHRYWDFIARYYLHDFYEGQ